MAPFAVSSATLLLPGSDPVPGRLYTWKGLNLDDPEPMIAVSVSEENIVILYPEGNTWQGSIRVFLYLFVPMIFPDTGDS